MSSDGNAMIWPTKRIGWEQSLLQNVAFNADSTRLAVAGPGPEIVLWDTRARTPLDTLRGHVRPVTSVAYSADGRFLASGDDEGGVRLWAAHPQPVRLRPTGT